MKSACRKMRRSMVMPARKLSLERVELAIQPRRQLDRVAPLAASGRRRSRRACRCGSPRRASARRLRAHRPRRAPGRRARRAAPPRPRRSPRGVLDAADRFQHVLLGAFGVDARRCVLARASHRRQELGQRDVVRAQRVGVRDDLKLSLGSADRRDLRDAGHGQQAPAGRSCRRWFGASADRRCPTRSRRRGSRP